MRRLGYYAVRRAGRRLGRPGRDPDRRARSRALRGASTSTCRSRTLPTSRSRSRDQDKADLAAIQQFSREESGYANEQSTKPQTLGVALNDSPAGLLAWIVEKFRGWSDCDGDPENVFTRDQLITNVMTYWVTRTITSSARLYWEHMHPGPGVGAPEYVEVPTGVARYPKEVLPLPAQLGRASLQRDRTGPTCPAAATSPRWSSPSSSSTTCAPSSARCAERGCLRGFASRSRAPRVRLSGRGARR